MATNSDSSSESEFFDAIESPSKLKTKRSTSKISTEGFDFTAAEEKNRLLILQQKQQQQFEKVQQQQKEQEKNEFPFQEPKKSRQRFKKLRECMNDEDENVGNTPDSQNSSADGVYASSKGATSHPFRIIENDAMSIQSMQSLGRVGRILSGSLDPSSSSVGRDSNQLSMQQNPAVSSSSLINSNSSSNTTLVEKVKDQDTQSMNSSNTEYSLRLAEPDLVSSTKLAHSKTTDSITSTGPVAPPRKKRNKGRKISSSSSDQFYSNEPLRAPFTEKVPEKLVIAIPTLVPTPTTSTNTTSSSSTSTSNTSNNKSTSDEKILPSPATIYAITKEIENSFQRATSVGEASTSHLKSPSTISRSTATGSLNKIPATAFESHRKSSSTSVEINPAPGRVTVQSIDPNQSLNIYKATRGSYCVKPQDGMFNKAEGPQILEETTEDETERKHKLRLDLEPVRDRQRFSGVGSNSLGSSSRYSSKNDRSERRKSAGDEEIMKHLNLLMKTTRTDSGKHLTDMEILEQVPVKNLDTGENFPLSAADEKLPQCINPLSLHIMRLTSYIPPESDEESTTGPPPGSEMPPGEEEEDNEIEEGTGKIRRKTYRIRKFFSSTAKKAANTAKSIASEVSHARHKEDVAEIVDCVNPEQNIKIKASKTNSGPYEFAKLQHCQDLSGEHTGAVWCMKFSSCGRLLATAGQDKVLRIWVLKDAFSFFQDMRTKYNADQKSSPTPSQESLVSHHSTSFDEAIAAAAEKTGGPFMPKAFCTYSGHTSDLLDVSWSKNYFILSSSMDKTVRLWHISRRECLCCFQHIDFVTAIAFHPRDDRYFLSGSLDGKLRLWNIPDKKVALWNEVDGQTKLITAANFCQNGKFAVVGSYDGRCLFYNTDQLKYHTQIHVRSTRGKNATGRKISGIEPMPGEDKILVTSNDSRVRLYDLRDLNLSCKYKGYLNVSSQIKASFSHDGKYIIAGSENQCIYIWKTHHDYAKLSSVRRDRSDFWEGIKAHNATVTCAIFAPHPEAIIKPEIDNEMSDKSSNNSQPADPLVEQRTKGCGGYVMVSADFNGCIKVFLNKTKPKHSSLPYTAILD